MNFSKELFIKEIQQNFNNMFVRQFFENNSLKEKLKTKNIDLSNIQINYIIEENNKDINVKIIRDKNNKNKYTIIFYYGFLEYFFKQAQNFSKNILNRNDRIYWTIFYYWMEIVFLHEWSHLIRNHFNLLTNSASFNEFGVNSNDLSIEKRKCLEIDADRYAGMFFAGMAFLTFNKLKKLLHSDNNEILQFFIKLIYFLFLYLEGISNSNNISHPDPYIRTILLLTGFQEAKYHNSELFSDLSLKELESKIMINLINEIFKDHRNIQEIIIDNINIFHQYEHCIKELLNGKS